MVPNPNDEPVISVVRAGELLGLSRSSAYTAARDGTLPTIRAGRRLLVPTAKLLELLGLDHNPNTGTDVARVRVDRPACPRRSRR
jgi:hypothetical protein